LEGVSRIMKDICPECGDFIDENDELILCPYCLDEELCIKCLTNHYEEDCKEFPNEIKAI